MNIEKFLVDIGPVLRGLVRDAANAIRSNASNYVLNQKLGTSGLLDDVVTSADIAAQKIYVDALLLAYPWIGLVGEENNLKKVCDLPGEDIYVTIDPLDGTKAFARNQSHGIGTMVSVVRNSEVIASYVGDVNSGDVYGFAPDSPIPTRVRFGVESKFDLKLNMDLGKRYILLACPPDELPLSLARIARKPENGGLFKSMEVSYGSFGILCARLWKGEVGALVLEPGKNTPWDITPAIGMMDRLGFVELKIHAETGEASVFENKLSQKTTYMSNYFTMYVHKLYVGAVVEALKK